MLAPSAIAQPEPTKQTSAVDAGALPGAVSPKDRNAAIKYLAVFSQLPKAEMVSGIDWDVIGTSLDASKMPEDYKKVAALVDREQIDALRRATALNKCDFENHYEEGWAMLLPSLGRFRHAARLMRVDTREAMIRGDLDRATDNIVALFRMVDHVTRDPILICSLVGNAMSEYYLGEVRTLINAPGVTREQKQRIADAIRAMGDDPFNARGSVEGERSLSLKWMRDVVRNNPDNGRAKIVEAIGLSGDAQNDSPEHALVLSLGREELLAFIDLADPVYDDILAAWDTPDAIDRFKEIEARIQSGGYGLFASIFAPAFSKARYSTSLGELHLRQLVDDLESRPAKVAAPAVSPAPSPATSPAKPR